MALVIGNSKYAKSATAQRRQRRPADGLHPQGPAVRGLQLFRRGPEGHEARRAAFTAAAQAEAAKDTVALVYYAGHGVQVKGENYLIPADANIEKEADVDIESVGVSGMMSAPGAYRDPAQHHRARRLPDQSLRLLPLSQRGLARIDAPTGSIVAFSTAPGKAAQDGAGGNSPYTSALAVAFGEPGLKIEEVFKRARIVGDRDHPRRADAVGVHFADGRLLSRGPHRHRQAERGATGGPGGRAQAARSRMGKARGRHQAPRAGRPAAREQSAGGRDYPEAPGEAKPKSTLDVIREGLAALGKAGGVIDSPTRPEEHYHNARLYETRRRHQRPAELQRIFRVQAGGARPASALPDLPHRSGRPGGGARGLCGPV